jgi:hypothetical protein
VWSGLSSTGIPTKLDTTRLNLAQEIVAKLSGVRTYQIHKTLKSFEATPRLGAALAARGPVVLAMHVCFSNVLDIASDLDYFPQPKRESVQVRF